MGTDAVAGVINTVLQDDFDGLTIDAEGGVWVALWGGSQVRRYDADGRRCQRRVDQPDPDNQALVRIQITYRVRATNDRRNLVYPFYVIPHDAE